MFAPKFSMIREFASSFISLSLKSKVSKFINLIFSKIFKFDILFSFKHKQFNSSKFRKCLYD